MAVALVNSTNAAPGNNQATTMAFTVSGTNPAIFFEAGLNSSSETVTSVLWSLGGTGTLVMSNTTGSAYNSVWVVAAPSAGAGTLSIGVSAAAIDHQYSAAVYSGVHQTTPSPTGDAVSSGVQVTSQTLTVGNWVSGDGVYGGGVNTNTNNPTGVQPLLIYSDGSTPVNMETGYNLTSGTLIINYDSNTNYQMKVAVRIAQAAGAAAKVPYVSIYPSILAQ